MTVGILRLALAAARASLRMTRLYAGDSAAGPNYLFKLSGKLVTTVTDWLTC
jgi:hypothetical protein